MQPTIFALSSGSPPSAIAVVRVSGPRAGDAVERLAGKLPPPRRAVVATLRDGPDGLLLDRALLLWMPGPATATGEDLAEFHLHGGRAVVAAILDALGRIAGLRAAEAGEFTRRSFLNGRIDLAEAEGLADLLSAETEGQRRQALRLAEGGLGRLVEEWRQRALLLAARVEAAIDHEDESDVPQQLPADEITALAADLAKALANPPAERLRDGFRLVVAGPPNAGKSSLINALSGREVALTSEVAGTTRDLIEAPLNFGGLPCILIDSAGLRDSDDAIEQAGIGRARGAIEAADLVLWLGEPGDAPAGALVIHAKSDLSRAEDRLNVSAHTGEGIEALRALLIGRLTPMVATDAVALNRRHRDLLGPAQHALAHAATQQDPLLMAEELRFVLVQLDAITGRAGTEDMLDALFGRFCIGK